jgi:hypothetical protein
MIGRAFLSEKIDTNYTKAITVLQGFRSRSLLPPYLYCRFTVLLCECVCVVLT